MHERYPYKRINRERSIGYMAGVTFALILLMGVVGRYAWLDSDERFERETTRYSVYLDMRGEPMLADIKVCQNCHGGKS